MESFVFDEVDREGMMEDIKHQAPLEETIHKIVESDFIPPTSSNRAQRLNSDGWSLRSFSCRNLLPKGYMFGIRSRLLAITQTRIRIGCRIFSTTWQDIVFGLLVTSIFINWFTIIWRAIHKDANQSACSIKAEFVSKMKWVYEDLPRDPVRKARIRF